MPQHTKASECEVSFVLTSCGRPDLLQTTVESFLEANSHPIARFILIEDAADEAMTRFVRRRFGKVFDCLIVNDPKLGQIGSIERAYREIVTPYVFHCEDDWRFVRSGFIERSFELLDLDVHIINVWLRGLHDTSGHPVEPHGRLSPTGIHYRRMAVDQMGSCQGFTFNPTLKRISDFSRIGALSALGSEAAVAQRFRDLGYYAVTLDEVYVEHIGGGRHIALPGDRRYLRTMKHRLRNLVYRHLHVRGR